MDDEAARRAGTPDGNPHRDVGPYADAAQALRQFDAVTHGIPVATTEQAHGLHVMVLSEALMVCGVNGSADWTEFEDAVMRDFATTHTPEEVQVFAGWLYRSWAAGREHHATP